jgi:adenylate cyclase
MEAFEGFGTLIGRELRLAPEFDAGPTSVAGASAGSFSNGRTGQRCLGANPEGGSLPRSSVGAGYGPYLPASSSARAIMFWPVHRSAPLSTDRVERRLTAILAADVAGYSRLTGLDEEGTHARLQDHLRSLVDPKIAEHRGRVVKNTGDGLLAEFSSVVDAVRCAVGVQRGMAERNADVPREKRIEFRIGINVGDVMIDRGDIFGDGVNVAVRLEGVADPGGICVSGRVLEHVEGKLDMTFEDAGECQLKNIERKVQVYRVHLSGGAAAIEQRPLPLPDKASIAVLPFQNMSHDPEQEFFGDGVVEEIITALSRIRWLFVIARNSSFTYKGRTVDIKQVGRELGVRYVLEGSVRKAAERVRVTAQLIDAEMGHHIWADRYDCNIADIFAVQDEITERVVASVEPQLYAAEGIRAKRKAPESLDAWESVMRALSYINNRSQADYASAQKLLKRAIELDPTYAQAYALFAYLTALEILYGWLPREMNLGAASDAAQKAVLLDVDDPWAHLALGFVHARSHRAAEAVLESEKALALNPNFAIAHTYLASALNYLGRSDEALVHLDIAERLSPRGLFRGVNNLVRAGAYFVAGRYREAIDCGQKAVLESPGLVTGYRSLVVNCALAGEIGQARSALEMLKHLSPGICLKWIESDLSFVREQDRRRYLEAFRLAGLE